MGLPEIELGTKIAVKFEGAANGMLYLRKAERIPE
jgi:hypothetical protein